MSKALSNSQKRYLRGLAHDLKPILLVGAKGITEALIAELNVALEHHELLKVKFAAEDRETRDEWIAELVGRSHVRLITRIGHIAVLYRRHPENPQIVLPKS
jgi:RNA-binding protein